MRKKYIDNIRWITVVLVVIYHVIYMFNGVGVLGGVGALSKTQYQDLFLYAVYPWFMLLLFVISGMCARFYLENHTHREFLKSRTVKLLLPSTIGLFVFWWISGYFNMKIGGAFESLPPMPKLILYLIMCVSGVGPLWFIQMLWAFSVLLVMIRKTDKDRLWNICGRVNTAVPGLIALIIWGAANIGNVPYITVYRFGIYGIGYFIGYFVLSHGEVTERAEKFHLPLGAAAVVLGTAFVIAYWGTPYAEHTVLDTPLCSFYAWFAVLAILAFMKRYGNIENAFTRFMNKKAWGLYLFHYVPLSACAFYLYGVNIPPFFKYVSVATAAFAGGILLYEIMRRIPVLRQVVCGIECKKQANNRR